MHTYIHTYVLFRLSAGQSIYLSIYIYIDDVQPDSEEVFDISTRNIPEIPNTSGILKFDFLENVKLWRTLSLDFLCICVESYRASIFRSTQLCLHRCHQTVIEELSECIKNRLIVCRLLLVAQEESFVSSISQSIFHSKMVMPVEHCM